MRYCDSIFGVLLKSLSRRAFNDIVERHSGDRYAKSFGAWDHLVVMIFAQLSGASGLRGLEADWNAHGHHHYHLGSGSVARSTLSDANARRTSAIFAEVFSWLSARATSALKREGEEMVRLIDSSPIPLPDLCAWTRWNGRTKGLKLHLVHNPNADQPLRADITSANINDVAIGRAVPIEPGATYVFDKGYCDYAWWTRLDEAGCRFVTRPKTNVRFASVARLKPPKKKGDGFTVVEDEIVHLATQGRAKLALPLRRLKIETEEGRALSLVTNDLDAPANEIAQLYKSRWQIELFFRWIKQHLKIRTFLGRSENAVRLQLLAAMIAFLLLRIAAQASRSKLPPIRFAGLVRSCIFARKPLARLDKPPDRPRPSPDPRQMSFAYA
jgi:putative transposase